MKKMFKKLATCALATLVGVTSLAGCINVGPQGEQADRGKTQLYNLFIFGVYIFYAIIILISILVP